MRSPAAPPAPRPASTRAYSVVAWPDSPRRRRGAVDGGGSASRKVVIATWIWSRKRGHGSPGGWPARRSSSGMVACERVDGSRGRAPERREGTEQGGCEGQQHERGEGAGDQREREPDRQLAGGRLTLAATGGTGIVGQSVEHGSEGQALALGGRDRRRDLPGARPERGGQARRGRRPIPHRGRDGRPRPRTRAARPVVLARPAPARLVPVTDRRAGTTPATRPHRERSRRSRRDATRSRVRRCRAAKAAPGSDQHQRGGRPDRHERRIAATMTARHEIPSTVGPDRRSCWPTAGPAGRRASGRLGRRRRGRAPPPR